MKFNKARLKSGRRNDKNEMKTMHYVFLKLLNIISICKFIHDVQNIPISLRIHIQHAADKLFVKKNGTAFIFLNCISNVERLRRPKEMDNTCDCVVRDSSFDSLALVCSFDFIMYLVKFIYGQSISYITSIEFSKPSYLFNSVKEFIFKYQCSI